MAFPFIMPGVCHVGQGALSNLADELKRLDARRALLVCDPGIADSGVARKAEDVLRRAGVSCEVFSKVELEPSTDNVESAARAVMSDHFDIVVACGGGSSLDVAKGAAVLATNGGSIRDYMGIELLRKPGLPTVLIPTTAGTGAESTPNAIFALKDEQVKKGVVSRYMMATVAIVDPDLTLSCPPRVTAAAGLDALVHAVESYTAVKATVHTRIYALKAIQLIGSSLRKAVSTGSDLEARNAMSWGSFLAGISLANAGVGAVHALAYPLGGRFHVSHGVANGLLFPYVLELNVPECIDAFVDVARALNEPVDGLSPREAAMSVVEAVRRLSSDIGIPQRLGEVGVGGEDVESLTAAAVEQGRLLSNNPRALTAEDIKQAYMEAL